MARCSRVREPVIDLERTAAAGAGSAAGATRLGIFFASMAGGGLERMMLRTAQALRARGFVVDVLVADTNGPLADLLPRGTRLVALRQEAVWRARAAILRAEPPIRSPLASCLLALKLPGRLRALPALVRYFREERPRAVFVAGLNANLLALWARDLARSDARVVVSQRSTMSCVVSTWTWKRHVFPALIRRRYRAADGVVAVSQGVAEDLVAGFGVPREHITVVGNPVVSDDVQQQAAAGIDHPWFATGAPPVVLAAGRLHPAKDYPTLIRAFARVRQTREAKLLILGEGRNAEDTARHRAELTGLAAELGVLPDVALPGFVINPFPYMAQAAVFVLSSRWEGFGNVLVEALACGCPVVSTDCPSGPGEILDYDRYGRLVPVGEADAMAEAILAALRHPPDRAALRARAARFSVDRAVDAYLELLLGPPNRPAPSGDAA